MPVKRSLLLLLVAGLCVTALLGVWVLLFEELFGLEEEVLGTLGTLWLFLLPALAAATMRERAHWPTVQYATLSLSVLGTLVFLLGIWTLPWQWFDDTGWLIRAMLTLAIWPWALAWAALIGTMRFDNVWRWVRVATIGLLCIWALTMTVLIWTDAIDSGLGWRVVGALGILSLLGTMATPILYKARGIERDADVQTTPLEIHLRCPRCLHEQTLPTGNSRCRRCRLKIRIDIEEPRCPDCGYVLHGLTRPVCPECGCKFSAAELPSDAHGGATTTT